MKRRMAILLCMVMLSLTLFGCTAEDVGYLKMSQELAMVKGATASGSMDITYNPEALGQAMESLTAAVPGAETKTTLAAGKEETITLNYDCELLNSTEIKFHYAFSAVRKGVTYDLGDVFYDLQQGVYASKQSALGLYALMRDMDEKNKDSYVYSEAYQAAFTKALGEKTYLTLMDLEDMYEATGVTKDMMAETLKQTQLLSGDLYQAALGFLTKSFSGYSPNCVTKAGNGYRLSLTAGGVQKLLIDVCDYILKNEKSFYDATEDYLTVVNDLMSPLTGATIVPENESEPVNSGEAVKKEEGLTPGGVKTQAPVDFTLNPEMRGTISKAVAYAKTYLEVSERNGDIKDFENSYYKALVQNNASAFTSEIDSQFIYKNIALVKLTGKGVINVKDVSVICPQEGTPVAAVARSLEGLSGQFNPVESATIEWSKESEYSDNAQVHIDYKRAQAEPTWSPVADYDTCPYEEINDRIYLPLSDLCKGLGLEVSWDAKTMTASVIKDKTPVAVKGILKEHKTYVPVKEMEKLGYKVTYTEKPDWHTVSLVKK